MARCYRGHWRYGVQKQGMELRTLRVSLSLSLSLSLSCTQISLNYNQYIKMSYSSKLKKIIGLSFFNFDSFGFSLFAFRFSTKALGKNIIFVCFSNSERKWLVSPENTPHTLSSVFYGDFIFTLVTIFPSYSSLHSRIHGLAVLKNN